MDYSKLCHFLTDNYVRAINFAIVLEMIVTLLSGNIAIDSVVIIVAVDLCIEILASMLENQLQKIVSNSCMISLDASSSVRALALANLLCYNSIIVSFCLEHNSFRSSRIPTS